jgi:AcrR family transcriptional regulator
MFKIYSEQCSQIDWKWLMAEKRETKRELKREDLRARLIEATRSRIMIDGLPALRARDVTQDAGCALGALYTAFADLDELVLHVNSLTLRAIEASLALSEMKGSSPTDRLRNLARKYLDFAVAHRNLWKALFEHRLPADRPTPEWHLEEHLRLMDLIAEPLRELQPDMTDEERAIRARTLFGAVHGVISISLEGRFVGLPPERLERELDDFVMTIAAGASERRVG